MTLLNKISNQRFFNWVNIIRRLTKFGKVMFKDHDFEMNVQDI